MSDLDRQIEQLRRCEIIKESEVKASKNRIGTLLFHFRDFSFKFHTMELVMEIWLLFKELLTTILGLLVVGI